MTKTQKIILDTVIQSSRHLSADEVYWEVKKKVPSIALGTIYRNLNMFADSNLVRRVTRAGGPDRFEGNMSPHDHALCIRCGQMTDIKIHNLKGFLKSQMNCDIISFDLTVNCICPKCAKKGGEDYGENSDASKHEENNNKTD